MMEAREFQVVHDENRAQLMVAPAAPKRKTSKAQRMARRVLSFVAVVLMETVPAILAGILVGVWLVPAAYAERGYIAFGGEWLLIMVVMFAVANIAHKAIWKRLER